MASDNTDYEHGTMPVKAQESTFQGFMGLTTYGGAFIAVILLFPTLFYGTSLGWFPSLMTSLVFGVVLGMALKFKGAWYASIIGLGIVTGLLCAIFSALF